MPVKHCFIDLVQVRSGRSVEGTNKPSLVQ